MSGLAAIALFGLTDNFVKAKLSVMGFLGVTDAARRMGVTTRQVQHLARQGQVLTVARGIVDETSVDRYLAARRESRRRPWSEATAWGAVALLTNRTAAWMGGSQRSRLKARLRGLSADELVGHARSRAAVTRYAGHASTAVRLGKELVDTTRATEALGLAATTTVDGYVAVGDVDSLIARHGLIRDDSGRFTLRATEMDLTVVAELAQAGPVLAALDLAESLDVRERTVGLDALGDALERFRG
jgi:hypothetical protein